MRLVGGLFSLFHVAGRRSLVLRLMATLMVAGTLVICLSCAALYALFSRTVTQEISTSLRESVGESVRSLEQIWTNLYTQMDREYRTNVVLTEGMYSQSLTPVEYGAVFSALDSLVASNSAYDSIYVFNAQQGLVFSSIGPVRPIGEFYDADFLRLLGEVSLDNRGMPSVFYRSLQYRYGVQEHALPVVSIVMYEDPARGAIVWNLRQEALQDIISTSSSTHDTQTLLVGQEGQVISSSDPSLVFTDIQDTPLFQRIASGAPSSFYTKAGGREQLAVYESFSRFSLFNWYLVRLQDKQAMMASSRALLLVTAGLAFLFVTLSALAVLFSLQRITRPLTNLLAPLVEEGGPKADKDEFELLAATLSESSRNIDELMKSAHSHRMLARNDLLWNLLNQNVPNNWMEQCHALDLPTYPSCARVFSLSLRGEAGKDFVAQLLEFKDALASGHSQYEFYVMPHFDFLLVVVLGLPDDNAALRLSGEIRESGQALFSYPVAMGIGTACDMDALSQSATEASTACQYAFLFGEDAIIPYEHIHDRQERQCAYPLEIEREVLSDLRAGRGRCLEGVDQFFRTLSGFSYPSVQLATRQLLLALLRAILSMSPPSLSADEMRWITDLPALDRGLSRFATMKELQLWLTGRLETFLAERKDEQRAHDDPVSRAAAYLQEHFRLDTLTVQETAEAVGLSVNHLRTLYKNRYGVTISKQLQDMRFALACELLANTEETVAQIGAQSGFSSANYFRTAFKREFGMTPEAYRGQAAKGVV